MIYDDIVEETEHVTALSYKKRSSKIPVLLTVKFRPIQKNFTMPLIITFD